MLLLRIGFVAVVAIMLLPRGPVQDGDMRRIEAGENGGFCDRYPKTCEASVELSVAFRQKLSYGISLARRSLESQPYDSAVDGRSGAGSLNPDARSFRPPVSDGRVGEWRPDNRTSERSTEWRLQN